MSRWRRFPILYLTVLFIEYVFASWLLSDCNAPWLTWAGTQAVTLHLSWVGPDAVALAVAWIVAIVWAGAFSMAWPRSVPWIGIPAWAAALAFSWILGLALVLTLAKTERKLQSIGLSRPQVFCILTTITWMALRLGRMVDIRF